MTLPKADLDSPWKQILRVYFPQAMQFFFPNTAALIDWGGTHEFLDKEFMQIARDAEIGKRYADQLVKVWCKNGEPLWLLVHLEVQSQSELDFPERMFVYSLRIFDLFRQIPVSLAILCDESATWRPDSFGATYPDSRMLFEFGTAKLLDWRDRISELESSDNPFATVVMTHLKVIETKRNAEHRKAWKFSLTRALYDKGYEKQQILDLYRFIDWIMILPEPLEREFWQELQTFEEERKVTYVSNAERFGFERGMQTGIQEGRQQGRQEGRQEGKQQGRQEGELAIVLRQLTRRFNRLPESVTSQIEALSLSQLESLGDALLDFMSLADLQEWLRFQAE
jgi:Domain of unknown function (DUF4351)